MFSFLNTILGFYANCGMAWVVTVAADIVINKYLLKISPKRPEFRRGMLYAINPVGFGSMIVVGRACPSWCSSAASGAALQPFSPLVAIVLALVLPPVLALATRAGTTCGAPTTASTLPMYDEHGNPSGLIMLNATSAGSRLERPDMAACAAHDAWSARCA